MKVIVTGNARSGTSFLTNLIHVITNYNCGNGMRGGNIHNKFGYWEHIKLNNVTNQIMSTIPLKYHPSKSVDTIDFTQNKFKHYKNIIKSIVKNENIELYKDNKLLFTHTIYEELFPKAKWVYIKRNVEDSYDSAFGFKKGIGGFTLSDYSDIVKRRLDYWNVSDLSKNCLTLNYEDFNNNIDETIIKLVNYLGVVDYDLEKLKKVYRDKQNR
jgi:hypothetical protein